tara:strand:+ start:1593 stop:2339 length:747 start_codon:yes stop_codon:yes gene_type:complete
MFEALGKIFGSVGGGGILGFLGPVGLLTGIASLASGKKSIGEAARDAMLGGVAGKALGIGSFGDIGQVLGTGGKTKAATDGLSDVAKRQLIKEADRRSMEKLGSKGILDRIKDDPFKAATQAATLYGIFGALGEKQDPPPQFAAADMETLPDYEGRVFQGMLDPFTGRYDRPIPVRAREGGFIQGPGTKTSDSIDAGIYQNGRKVQEAKLSDGEFVMRTDAVEGLGGGDRAKGAARMYALQNQFSRMA